MDTANWIHDENTQHKEQTVYQVMILILLELKVYVISDEIEDEVA
jgi:hypothetical protein